VAVDRGSRLWSIRATAGRSLPRQSFVIHPNDGWWQSTEAVVCDPSERRLVAVDRGSRSWSIRMTAGGSLPRQSFVIHPNDGWWQSFVIHPSDGWWQFSDRSSRLWSIRTTAGGSLPRQLFVIHLNDGWWQSTGALERTAFDHLRNGSVIGPRTTEVPGAWSYVP
jgi:hypothetical protein